ncbi:MAG: TonB-dependent receptor [Gracilimonas sp.]|uniref:TonB-dependent receptor n=1 Tax=Gracilimonas sp. TaxID=1974203 RepID=UPI0019B0DEC3|nr:TonB-dependent receptor [Gracilimonas sp.]MBD3617652.1 TonB-dependent receptor [Gracilimonas sp.]
MKYLLTILLFLLMSAQGLAQRGTVTGVVVDKETGEELIGANVFIRSISQGAATDISGRYNLRLEPGVYTLEFSFITFQKQIVEDVEVEAGKVLQLDIVLVPDNEALDEVIISARRLDNNEASLLRLQQKSLPVQDGISSEEMSRAGFSNSAESMRQVTGASVEGGKFIVMRGLGDRYSISSMDGVVLPTTNPYRNSAGLDLIPSSTVDNIVVKKTFSPDLPGNFSGGAVDVTTKSLPDRLYFKLSSTVSYNDQTTFNNNFMGDPIKNSLSRLGYDDGSRARESLWSDSDYLKKLNNYIIQIQNNMLSPSEIESFNSTMRSFSNRAFTVSNETPGLNHSLNVMVGNRYALGSGNLGFNLGVNYSKSFVQYDEREINNFTARIPEEGASRMQAFQLNSGSESSDQVDSGLMGAVTYQPGSNHEFTYTSIYNNSASESVLDMRDGYYPGALSSGTYNNRVISFVQRELFNNQLKGRHHFDGFDVKWSANYIESSQYEPDTRFIGAPVDNSGQYFFVREVPLPFHFFRDLDDTQYNLKLDGETNISRWFKLKTGAFYTRKDRDFNEFRYQLENNGTDPDFDGFISFREASGNYEGYFSPENTGVIGNDGNGNNLLGITYRDQTRPQNSYTGFEQVSAFYLMGIFDFTDNFKAFAGARVEKTDFNVQSSAVNAQKGEIDVTDVLPSLNVIYSLNEKTNIRLSASQTLARPNIRELAPFASFDLLGGFPIVGNPEITRTNVTNLDFRYEIFPKSTELVAISAFYKDFKNPIVMELDVASDQPQYQYINTNSGRLFGVELEFRKGLGFISSRFDNFKFSTNFTYINSRVDLSDNELETRRRLDPSIKAFRSFPSQSPYIVNFMLNYENQETGWDGNIYANVFGPRLTANGAGAAPDIFEMYGKLDGNGQLQSERPVPDLNIKVRKTFVNGLSAALSVSNILDFSIIQYQEDNGEYFINSALNPGRTVSLSFTYDLN